MAFFGPHGRRRAQFFWGAGPVCSVNKRFSRPISGETPVMTTVLPLSSAILLSNVNPYRHEASFIIIRRGRLARDRQEKIRAEENYDGSPVRRQDGCQKTNIRQLCQITDSLRRKFWTDHINDKSSFSLITSDIFSFSLIKNYQPDIVTKRFYVSST
jgi:hypothetical protein